jgi:LCP family protein required for cell wall assembly
MRHDQCLFDVRLTSVVLPGMRSVGVRGPRVVTVGRVGYMVLCMAAVLILIVAGFAAKLVGLTEALGDGAALSSDPVPISPSPAPRGGTPAVGATNILVIGLESRTNFQGQDLSVQQLTETHSGNQAEIEAGLEGSQDTDTLILIHVFAGGQKAVGFSIPRDDVVNYPHATYDGLTEGKIDAAYAYAYDESLGQTVGTSMSQDQRYLKANQAGELFAVQTVESVTGVHIDHFIESNIIGFYELAQQLGGMEVCVQPAPAQDGLPAGANLTDDDPLTGSDNSGFDAYKDGYNAKQGGKQYLHLSAAQSLAYVRSRDTLPGVDIGRTARQQAAIDYFVWKLRSMGVLGDIRELTTLLSDAHSYLTYDSGWNLIDFASAMNALNGTNLNLTTLPAAPTNNVEVPGYPGLQSVNFIDEPAIRQQVNQAFYGTPAVPKTASSVTVDVYNESDNSGLAGDVSQDLAGMGYKAGAAVTGTSQSLPVTDDTEVFYGAGSATEANAETIASLMGATAAALPSLAGGHVEVLLGSQVTAQPPGLETFAADTVDAADYSSVAQQDNMSVPPGVTAAGTAAGTQSVSATLFGAPTPASGTPPSSTPASGTPAKSSAVAETPTASSSTAPAGSMSSPNPPYGLTTCPY